MAYLDAQLSELHRALQQRGLLENTILIITADHGEEFGEHGQFWHGYNLYMTSLRVPLLVVLPPGKERQAIISEAAGLQDMAATIVDLVSVSEGSPFPGATLRRFWESSPEWKRSTPILSELNPRTNQVQSVGTQLSIIADGYHYLQKSKDQVEELYRLDDDWEQVNLADHPSYLGIFPQFLRSLKDIFAIRVDCGPAMTC
jgi:arylsulfatase A-like enzyme